MLKRRKKDYLLERSPEQENLYDVKEASIKEKYLDERLFRLYVRARAMRRDFFQVSFA